MASSSRRVGIRVKRKPLSSLHKSAILAKPLAFLGPHKTVILSEGTRIPSPPQNSHPKRRHSQLHRECRSRRTCIPAAPPQPAQSFRHKCLNQKFATSTQISKKNEGLRQIHRLQPSSLISRSRPKACLPHTPRVRNHTSTSESPSNPRKRSSNTFPSRRPRTYTSRAHTSLHPPSQSPRK